MIQKAIKKLKDEIGNDNGYKQIIGGFLLQQLESSPSASEQILKEGKTIKGAMEAMKAAAQKHQQGGCAVLTDDEGFAVVLEYFDMPMVQVTKFTRLSPLINPETQKNSSFNVSLDDLLG